VGSGGGEKGGERVRRMLGRRSRGGEEKNGLINIAREVGKDSIGYTPSRAEISPAFVL